MNHFTPNSISYAYKIERKTPKTPHKIGVLTKQLETTRRIKGGQVNN